MMSDVNYDNAVLARMALPPEARVPGTWRTYDGAYVLIRDMRNSHLRNAIEMLRRNALRRLVRHAVFMEPSRYLYDDDERAYAAFGEVYHDLLNEALSRSADGDLAAWMEL